MDGPDITAIWLASERTLVSSSMSLELPAYARIVEGQIRRNLCVRLALQTASCQPSDSSNPIWRLGTAAVAMRVMITMSNNMIRVLSVFALSLSLNRIAPLWPTDV